MSEFKNFALSVNHVQWLDFKKIFSWTYLSDTALSFSSPLVALLGYFFIFLILIGIILVITLNKKNKKMPIYKILIVHISNMTTWLGIIGLILVLARFQGIYMLSNRLVMLLNMLAITIWTLWIVYYTIVKLPKLRKIYKKQQAKEKYLPKPKIKKIRL